MPTPRENHKNWYLQRGFRYHLVIVQLLIFALPLMVVLYISHQNGFTLDASQLLLAAMTLVLVLAGMMMLRQVFDHFFGLATVVAETGSAAEADELKEISFSFSRLMRRFERATGELKRRVFELFTIRELTEVASKVLDIDELLKCLLDRAMDVSGARIGSVFFYEAEMRRLRTVAHTGLHPGPEKNTYIRVNKSLLRQVVEKKKPLLITDIETDPRTRKPNDARYGNPSFLAMPILSRSGVVAVLSLASKRTGRAFDHDDERVLTILLKEVGFAIENARLHSKVEMHLHQLEQSEKKYRSILERIQCGYYETDLKGRLTFFNDTIKQIFNADSGEIEGQFCLRYLAPESIAGIQQAAAKVRKTGRPGPVIECVIVLPKDRRRFIETAIFPIRSVEGVLTGFRGVVWDITDRKAAAEEKKELEARLKKRQRLEAVGTLAGGVAHNFNNLLMGISGNAALMQIDQEGGGRSGKQLENIERLIQRGARLTSQLLGFARGGKYDPKPMDLNRLAGDIAETFRAACKNICFHRRFDPALPPVVADKGQMEQVMMNLLINATEAMPEGGDLFIETAAVPAGKVPTDGFQPTGGDYVRMTFRDSGGGMDQQTLERAFEPFFTTKDISRQGRGMGLSSAYGIVKAHDGTVEIQSVPGNGTAVSVFLPASVPVPAADPCPDAPVPRGDGMILLVDDEKSVLEVGAMMMRSLGYQVFEADSGAGALEIMGREGENVDLVILDMIMPEMSGEEVFARLRNLQPGVKVLLSSGYSRDGKTDKIMDLGCDGFLQKPFGLGELARTLADLMSPRRN